MKNLVGIKNYIIYDLMNERMVRGRTKQNDVREKREIVKSLYNKMLVIKD